MAAADIATAGTAQVTVSSPAPGGGDSGALTFTVLDTRAPTVAVTAPTAGTTVSGTVSVTANASDNTGVVGLQFKLDGAALGPELTSAPYSLSWDTTTVPDGGHTLTAVARDAAGLTTSAAVAFTVTNNAMLTIVTAFGEIPKAWQALAMK